MTLVLSLALILVMVSMLLLTPLPDTFLNKKQIEMLVDAMYLALISVVVIAIYLS